MSLTRTAWTDDSGLGTDGTILNNAEKTVLYDQIDARWSVVTQATTGTEHDVSFSEADMILGTNATLRTLTGLLAPASPVKPGKPLEIFSLGAGNLVLNNEDAGSTAGNRIVTGAGVAITLASGVGRALLIRDQTALRWRVLSHEQGQGLPYTVTWSASGVAPAIGNGTLTGFYYLRGRQVSIGIYLSPGSTTTFGTGTYSFSLPLTALTSGSIAQAISGRILDTGTAHFVATGIIATSTTVQVVTSGGLVGQTIPMTWAIGDVLEINGLYYLP